MLATAFLPVVGVRKWIGEWTIEAAANELRRPVSCVDCSLRFGGSRMKKRITVSRKGLAALKPEDRMRVFQEDLQALDELAAKVHAKAIEGDNAAGHLDLKIRERKAAMFGYDSPQRYDMTLIAESKKPTMAETLLKALSEMKDEGKLSDAASAQIEGFDQYQLPKPSNGTDHGTDTT
jgi:hypothetical protein